MSDTTWDDLHHSAGFANEHASEARPGALPVGQFSPQRVPFGLYAEKFSGTAFTAPRAQNRRTWFYRLRPAVGHGRPVPMAHGGLRTAPLTEGLASPAQLRWDPWPLPPGPADFVDGLVTLCANGHCALQTGLGIHVYAANRDMTDRYFCDADGELLLVPQQGRLRLATECGRLEVRPGEIALVPRGMRFQVLLPDGPSRGYVCENYGQQLRLPERGPVGSDGYANDRDFLAPVACFEDRAGEFELVTKFGGALYRAALAHSPLDVVAWIGTAVPLKYDLLRFNVMGTVSYDHPDPSIFTVLTAPSDTPGVANCDFVIFPPRWMVAEHTFRPPWFHRNVMSEFMGLVYGVYDAKEQGFVPGGASLHNCMAPHGPEAAVHRKASEAALGPVKQEATLAFMFESRYAYHCTAAALAAPGLQADYADCWRGLDSHYTP
jgi:homogentisate 1,2-dioxygenase